MRSSFAPGRHLPGTLAASALIVFGTAFAASAQVLTVPRRAAETTTRPDPAAPPVSSLRLDASAFGGYDDNVSQGGDTGGEIGAPPLLTGAGTTGQFNLGLEYRRSRGTRSLSLGGQGSVDTYQGLDLGPSQYASLVFAASTGLGRSNILSVSEALSYDSLYGLDSLGAVESPVGASGELPTSGAVEGLLRQKSWATATAVGLSRDWSRRDQTTLGYTYSSRTFTGSNGETSFTHAANAGYSHAMNRTSSLYSTYTYSNAEYAGGFTAGPRRPVDSHNIEGGLSFTKRVSPRRSLHFSFGGGASYVETVSTDVLEPYQYWAPTGSVDARLDLSQTWTLAGNFRRTTTGFEGLSQETFISDVVGASVGGQVNRRVRLVFSGGGARGNVDASAAGTGEYTTATGAVQLGIAITETLSATAQYSYYRYNFSEDTVLANSLPPEFNRNAVRVGLTLALPLGRQPRMRP